MAATDAQMQAYCDQRIRPRAEQLRALLNAIADDKAAISDEYARAVSASAWADARTDGPPHLLQSGNSANPDDLLNYNAIISALTNLVNGTSVANGSTVATDAATLHGNWSVLMNACVRPVGS
jgi:hypothetical protein